MKLRGVIHVHSTYSDGEMALEDLLRVFRADGNQFVAMTDHAEMMDDAAIERFARACRDASTDAFCVLPGFELAYHRSLHVLGIGIDAPVRADNTLDGVNEIHRLGGLAVWAHPAPANVPWVEGLGIPWDGVELWNTRYDRGRGVRPARGDLLARLRQRSPSVFGYYGLDFHRRDQTRSLRTCVEADACTPPAIKAALISGRFDADDGGERWGSAGEGASTAPSGWTRDWLRSLRRTGGLPRWVGQEDHAE